jgi:uncharacterized protein (DUF58 family)
MHTITRDDDSNSVIDREALQALGVLMPLRLSPLKFMPGRHPLGRAGSGLRFLRTRPFVLGEDNPRDIDKFSLPTERMVIEWEEEVQASVLLFADVSASMSLPQKQALRNAALLQLTYSLWRSGDRVGTVLFSSSVHQEVKAANLKTQMERLARALGGISTPAHTDIPAVLRQYLNQGPRFCPDLLFVVSDFVSTHEDGFELDFQWQSVLSRLQNNLIPVVITFEIPAGFRGMVKLWDPERRSRRLTWFSSGRVNQINKEERDRVSSLIQKFRAAGLDYLIISSQRQIYPQLSNLARQRRGRKN